MTLDFHPAGPSFCAEVTGVDFSRPIDAATLAAIIAGMDRYAVCVYRATGLDDERHIQFSPHQPAREESRRVDGRARAMLQILRARIEFPRGHGLAESHGHGDAGRRAVDPDGTRRRF